jgi:uncharacterized protein YbjQ (UPF0145 family)
MFDARLAFAAVFVAVLAAIPTAMAQKSAAQIVLTEGDAPTAHTVLGEVRAEAHKTSLFSKVSVREVADQQLRDQAAKMGADAVIGIKYEDYNPMTSKKGFRAVGRAVKFTTALAAAAPAAAAPATALVAPQPAAPAAAIVAPPVQVAAAAPVAAPVVAAPPAAAGLIALSEQDIPGRPYQIVSEISSEVHPTSMFPKKSARDLLNEDLRAKAARLGADAVIQIKYTSSNPMFSKKGSTAVGKAVKFIPLQPLAAPTPVATTPAPIPAPAPPPPIVVAAPAAAPAPQPAPLPVAPVVAAASAAPAASPGILLSEQNLSRAYDVLGPVNAELNQASVSLDKTGRQVLDEALRKQAADLGADAVILIRYAGPAGAKGPTAIGVAVKFK